MTVNSKKKKVDILDSLFWNVGTFSNISRPFSRSHNTLIEEYQVVAKVRVYRDNALGKPATRVHHYHGSLVTAGLGYDDLNELMKSPHLEFISVR